MSQLSLSQRIAKFILPGRWFDRMRASSEQWMVQCTGCQSERSVWSTGGIRWAATSKAKRIAAACSTCGNIVAARVYHRENPVHKHVKGKPETVES